MRMTRSLLLTGTILPSLLMATPSFARPLDTIGSARTEWAQLGEEPRGGGGPRGGAGGAERGGPPAARERPEPRPAAPAAPTARERPDPVREAPAARERPDVPAARDRPTPPTPPAAREKPDPREAPAVREKPDTKPTPPATREKPDPREAPAAREKPDTKPGSVDERPNRPNRPDAPDRSDKPDRPAVDRTAPPDRPTPPGTTAPPRPGAPNVPNQPQPPVGQQPGTGPNQRPGTPDRSDKPDRPPVDRTAPPDRPTPPGTTPPPRPGAPNVPNQPQPPAGQQPGTAPNQRPGVPGRPFTPGGQPPNVEQLPNQPGARPGRDDRDARDRDGNGRQDLRDRNDRGRDDLRDTRDGYDRRDGDDRDRRDGYDRDRRDTQDRRDAQDRRDRFNVPGRPGYIPGGFRNDDDDIRDYERVRRDRQSYDVDGRSYYREPGRIIVRDRDGYYIRHDENERFRTLDRRGYRTERRGDDVYSYIDRPGGEQIVTVVDDDGRLLRRYRRYRDGREIMIINNAYGGPPRPVYEDVVDLPPPDISRIPRERYVVDYERADARAVYGALSAPPVVPIQRRYTLDQVRYSPQLRARMPSVDINTITFDSGSFTVSAEQARQLQTIADAINRAIKENPQEVFLIEGYTDAVGEEVDNLSLSDRRAQSVATVLTETFQVPPENLTTQGYGEQYLKVNTQEASRENRRVTVRRITPLIQQQAGGGEGAPPPQ